MRVSRIFLGLAALGLIASAAGLRLVDCMRTDLRADVAWHRVGAPVALRSRAYRWYPWSYPVLERWTRIPDDAHAAAYAFETIVHFGGPLAHIWLDRMVANDSTTDLADLTSNDRNFSQTLAALGVNNAQESTTLALHAARGTLVEPNDEMHFDRQLIEQLGVATLPALEQLAHEIAPKDREKLASVLPYFGAEVPHAIRQRAKNLAALLAPSRAPSPSSEATPSPIDLASERLNLGDPSVLPYLAHRVNGNLRVLTAVRYQPNLLAVAEAFPQSRLMHAYRAYDKVRGGAYFSRDDALDRNIVPALSHPEAWRIWLQHYPDHSGADDVAYWLGRALQQRGDRVAALRAYADALERNLGDGDMHDVLAARLLWMVDIGTTETDLRTYVTRYPHALMTPLMQYAIAVRHARIADFSGALALAPSVSADRIQHIGKLVETYVLYELVERFEQQRELWQRLRHASRSAIADAWYQNDGWKIGYLAYYNGLRNGGAAFRDQPGLSAAEIAKNMRAANPNAQSIAFAAADIAEASHDAAMSTEQIRQKKQRIIASLYEQLAEFPDAETDDMGELPGLPPETGRNASLFVETLPDYLNQVPLNDRAAIIHAARIETWWARELLGAARTYAANYPTDPFAATALLAAYEVSGQKAYLDQLLMLSPHGPRSEEARALRWALHS